MSDKPMREGVRTRLILVVRIFGLPVRLLLGIIAFPFTVILSVVTLVAWPEEPHAVKDDYVRFFSWIWRGGR